MRHTTLTLLALTSSAVAQFVSPAAFAKLEGTSNNTYPWSATAFSYQQVHGDVQGTPRLIVGMAFRRDTGFTDFASSTARSITLDAFLGVGTYATASGTYASNYSSAPNQVVTSKTFNAPDWTKLSIERPAPFNFVIAFDTPYVYTGVGDLVWEFRVTATTATGTYLTDFCSGSGVGTGSGSRLGTGTGCVTSNGTMTLLSNWTTSTTTHTLNWQVLAGPGSAAGAVAVGAFPIAIPLPGLCGSGFLYTDGGVLVLSGTTSTAGAINTSNITVPYDGALIGTSLYSQGAALDGSQNHGIAVSNGLQSTLGGTAPGIQCMRIWTLGNATATTGTVGTNNALVTQFR